MSRKNRKREHRREKKMDILDSPTRAQEQKETDITKANNKANLLDQLRQNHGIISKACEAAGVARQTYYNYRDEDKDFAAAADEAIDLTNDVAESVVIDLMLTSEVDKVRLDAAKAYLTAHAKKRGYGTEVRKQEISGELKVQTRVIVRLPDNGRRSYSGAPAGPADGVHRDAR
jgi:hypothetical protein